MDGGEGEMEGGEGGGETGRGRDAARWRGAGGGGVEDDVWIESQRAVRASVRRPSHSPMSFIFSIK